MKNPIALRIIFLPVFIILILSFLTSKTYASQAIVGSWTFLGLNNYIIHSFAVDHNNPNTLYAGTAGNGIFKSTDSGDTWNAINSGITNYAGFFTEIVIDPTNSNIVYAGGVNVDDGSTGILKSTDGGANWGYSHVGINDVGFGGPPADVHSMIIDPTNHNTLYAALGNRCGSVYKSTDAAATWTRGIGLPCDPTVVRIDPSNPNIVYTRSTQGINQSVDGGVNWGNISNFGNNSVFHALTTDPFSSSNLYANSDTGLHKSTDGGGSWSLSNGALNNIYKALITDPVRGNTVYAGENFSGGVSMTIDGGNIWNPINNGLPNIGIKRLLVPTNDPNLLYAGTEAGIYVYGLTNNQSLDLNVPLLKQTSSSWNNQIYDLANNWAPSNPTINAWGCALTSAAMVLKYHGINKLTDGTNLDPGTLNAWLKNQPDGYVRNGWVNWLALSRLSRLAKSINGISSFNALEYNRTSGYSPIQLTTDIDNGIPGILEEPGHFIVGKGISGSTFNINDPYHSRSTLSEYGNTFLSLGRFIPSSTDLSYIMLVTDPSINIVLKDSVGNLHGEQFMQQPLVSDEDISQKSGSSLKFFYFKKPTSGQYQVELTSPNTQNYDLKMYLYDKDGNVNISDQSGLTSQNSPDAFSINFDSQTSNNSSSLKIITFQSLIDDIKEAQSLSLINKNTAKVLTGLAKSAKKNYEKGESKIALIKLRTIEKLLNSFYAVPKEILIKAKAYQILFYDINYLKTHI